MKKSTNLKLNIIEGTDIPNYAPWNENMNLIDSAYKSVSDSIKANKSAIDLIDSATNDTDTVVANLGNSVNDLENSFNDMDVKVDMINERVEHLMEKSEVVTVIENGKEKKYNKDVYRFKIASKNIGGNRDLQLFKTSDLPTELGHYCALQLYNYYVGLNLTDLIGLPKSDDLSKYIFKGWGYNANPEYGTGKMKTFPHFELDYVWNHKFLNCMYATFTSRAFELKNYTDYPEAIVQQNPEGDIYIMLEVYKVIEDTVE